MQTNTHKCRQADTPHRDTNINANTNTNANINAHTRQCKYLNFQIQIQIQIQADTPHRDTNTDLQMHKYKCTRQCKYLNLQMHKYKCRVCIEPQIYHTTIHCQTNQYQNCPLVISLPSYCQRMELQIIMYHS